MNGPKSQGSMEMSDAEGSCWNLIAGVLYSAWAARSRRRLSRPPNHRTIKIHTPWNLAGRS